MRKARLEKRLALVRKGSGKKGWDKRRIRRHNNKWAYRWRDKEIKTGRREFLFTECISKYHLKEAFSGFSPGHTRQVSQ